MYSERTEKSPKLFHGISETHLHVTICDLSFVKRRDNIEHALRVTLASGDDDRGRCNIPECELCSYSELVSPRRVADVIESSPDPDEAADRIHSSSLRGIPTAAITFPQTNRCVSNIAPNNIGLVKTMQYGDLERQRDDPLGQIRLNKKAVPNACAPGQEDKAGRIGTPILELGGSRYQIESSLVTCAYKVDEVSIGNERRIPSYELLLMGLMLVRLRYSFKALRLDVPYLIIRKSLRYIRLSMIDFGMIGIGYEEKRFFVESMSNSRQKRNSRNDMKFINIKNIVLVVGNLTILILASFSCRFQTVDRYGYFLGQLKETSFRLLRSQRAPIVTAIAVVRGQPPFNYNLPKNTPFRKREALPHVRFKGLTTEAKLSRSLSLSVFRVVFEISERVVASIRKDHRDDRAAKKS
ncbi:hypothetical protein ALC62_00549 [Cyphomyrmex costatus]|uniref:Uncharacterized protein n=1 Tax=Cyphomyrmex costatus TaxID=456900 RepID=A0A151IQP6_9HYME|nr:hypothetical protein ALC62_00549 [Cyphomyrmex costatus]